MLAAPGVPAIWQLPLPLVRETPRPFGSAGLTAQAVSEPPPLLVKTMGVIWVPAVKVATGALARLGKASAGGGATGVVGVAGDSPPPPPPPQAARSSRAAAS